MLALSCCQLIPDADRNHAVHGPSSGMVEPSYNVLQLALRSNDDDLGDLIVIQAPNILQHDNNNSPKFASHGISTPVLHYASQYAKKVLVQTLLGYFYLVDNGSSGCCYMYGIS